MTRFKKELLQRGVKLEECYMAIPYEVAPAVYLEGTFVDSETATVTTCYNVIRERVQYDRSMQPHVIDVY